MTQAEKPRRYQGVNYKGHMITVVIGDKPKTMTIIQPDGSMEEVPYEERRSGQLSPVPQMQKETYCHD